MEKDAERQQSTSPRPYSVSLNSIAVAPTHTQDRERERAQKMGSSQTKEKSRASEKVVEGLKEKVRVLQAETNEIMRVRDTENQVYETELMVFAFKQAEWKRQRKELKDELKKLRRLNNADIFHKEEHQPTRDETVEKWKQLYFTIKLELDHLIHTTHQGIIT